MKTKIIEGYVREVLLELKLDDKYVSRLKTLLKDPVKDSKTLSYNVKQVVDEWIRDEEHEIKRKLTSAEKEKVHAEALHAAKLLMKKHGYVDLNKIEDVLVNKFSF